MYFAACLLEGEIYNGGFDQYFCNSSADFYLDAVRGLEEIGATECRRILLAAKQLVFGPREVPERAARLERLGKMTAAQADELEEFDRLFTNEAAGFRDRVAQFARKHRLYDA